VSELAASDAKDLVDSFGRRITYVRLSVTDRCDLRCRYCMSERMEFLPRRDVLTFEEMVELADIFIARGVTRIRLTGGEPLVRRGITELARELGSRVGRGLDELTMTTNGTQLERFAEELRDAVQARRSFDELKRKYPESDMIESADWMIENMQTAHPKMESLETMQQRMQEDKARKTEGGR